MSFVFKDPWILIFIPFVLGVFYLLKRRERSATFRFPAKNLVASLKTTWKVRFRETPVVLRVLVLVLFLIALAGPRTQIEETVFKTEGIDIVLAIDSSGSMAGEDFTINNRRINRLEIVKKVVDEFIGERQNDQIGLVAFAGLAYTVCPLTTDYTWLSKNLERITLGVINDSRTAIGSAIASSLSRLKQSKAKSKVIILLTDGVNNAGKVEPIAAARAAAAFGVKIYTIGAGSEGYVPFPVKDFFGRDRYEQVLVEMDEETLKEIADITDGQYFRATDTESLRQIYKEIDKLEKTEIEKQGYVLYEELFDRFLIAALLLLICELILVNTIFLKIP